MVFNKTIFRWKPLLFICLFVLILVLLFWKQLHFEMSSQTPTVMGNQTPTVMSNQTPTNQLTLSGVEHVIKPSCQNVLDNMVLGRWVKDKQKETEIAAMREFHRKARLYYGISQTLQRKDNQCGNLNLEGPGNRGIAMFRALCDPDGSTPCCFKNKCVLQETEKCRCQDCYDLRQKLHAELSTWIPANSTCKITMFVGGEDACKVLRHRTIYFIGDSFLRQLYTAVLNLMQKNKPQSVLSNHTPPDKMQYCDKYYALTDECSSWIRYDANECNNTVRLRLVSFWKLSQLNEILGYIEKLQRQPGSIIVIGYGLHSQFNAPVIENQIVNPLLLTLARSPWPKPVWLTPQSPGLLKSPGYSSQQKEVTVRYNLRINDIMKKRGIPVLDFFKMTEDVMSYDGTHYGIGVNDLKAQVLLNYILEIGTNA